MLGSLGRPVCLKHNERGIAVIEAGKVMGPVAILACYRQSRDFKLYPKRYTSVLKF